jgi:hypothetical protein
MGDWIEYKWFKLTKRSTPKLTKVPGVISPWSPRNKKRDKKKSTDLISLYQVGF